MLPFYKIHFNTSYVVIKHDLKSNVAKSVPYFNTSYVVIKHISGSTQNGGYTFQYILCCY